MTCCMLVFLRVPSLWQRGRYYDGGGGLGFELPGRGGGGRGLEAFDRGPVLGCFSNEI
jgi:hypothetical protein